MTIAKKHLGFTEIGASGLRRSFGVVDEQLRRELSGKKGMLQFKKMADYDDICGACLFAMVTLVKGAEFTWNAKDDTPASIDAKEFFESVFDDMSTTWTDTLSDILTMLQFGWAYMEIVWKMRSGVSDTPETRSKFTDNKIGVRKLAIRAQETLDKWEFDPNGGIQGMWQEVPGAATRVFVPIEKALLFRTSTVKNNPEGRSVLQNAWESWYYKTNIRTIESIGIERDLAGYPVIQLTEDAPDVWAENDPNAAALLAKLEGCVTGIRRDEQEGAVLPFWAKLSLLASSGKRNFDTSTVITRYDQRMAMTMLADFILLGHDAVGSKALSVTKVGIFTDAVHGIAKNICDVINRFLVTKVSVLNGIKPEHTPELVVSHVAQVTLAEIADFISKLSGAGAPLFPDLGLLDQLLGRAGLVRTEDDAAPLPAGSARAKPGDVDAIVDTATGDLPAVPAGDEDE